MTFYICSLPNAGEPGDPKELFTDDLALAERFAAAEDKRPGRGVYECINPLLPGARQRSLETVAQLQFIYFDLDLQHNEASRDAVIKRLQNLPVEFVWVRDSGSGNLHVGIEIKDPPQRETPEYDRLVAVWKRLAEKLAADPAPVHAAALIRCVGTHNKKNGGNGLCRQLWNGGGPLDITELEELDDLLAEPLLARKPRPTGVPRTGPVDVPAELATITDGASANRVQCRVIASLLRKGEHPDDVLRFVVDATLAQVSGWTRDVEVPAVTERIVSCYKNLLLKGYDPSTGAIPAGCRASFTRHGLSGCRRAAAREFTTPPILVGISAALDPSRGASQKPLQPAARLLTSPRLPVAGSLHYAPSYLLTLQRCRHVRGSMAATISAAQYR
jgi:hypothetical protein